MVPGKRMLATQKLILLLLFQQLQSFEYIKNYVSQQFEKQSSQIFHINRFSDHLFTNLFFVGTAWSYILECTMARDDVPKSSHWYDYVLPNLKQRDFILCMRMPLETLASLVKDLQSFILLSQNLRTRKCSYPISENTVPHFIQAWT